MSSLSFVAYPSGNRVYFSRDLEGIVVYCSSDARVTVTISASYSNPITHNVTEYGPIVFRLTPILHQAMNPIYAIDIKIKSIIEKLVPGLGIYTVTVSASSSDGTAEISFRTIRGGLGTRIYDPTKDLILTARPQVFRIHKGIIDEIGVPVLLAPSECTDQIKWIVYPSNLKPSVISYPFNRTSNQQLIIIKPPYHLFEDYPGGIRAIDLVIGDRTLRYIVMKEDARVQTFQFMNSFGSLDYIYSFGTQSRDFGGTEYKTTCIDDTEAEYSNDFREKFVTNTGIIGSQALIDLWGDFFRSSLHYAWRDGKWAEIILEDVSEGESTVGKIASFTFSWHLAEQPTGRAADYGALESYQYEVPEF